ncbi:hypothetical protein BT69DRAFT_1352405 [Atractiella rhizophila]|nr:hypothetical protein BT69DRAFT_1352405 [Atractiella rhizophila]
MDPKHQSAKEKSSKKRKFADISTDKDQISAENEKAPENGIAKKQKLILFVGNISSDVTEQQLSEHFASCGETPVIRIRQQRGPKQERKGRGGPFAFAEFTEKTALQSALRLHGTTLGKTKIRVELTAGGGGNSEGRKGKIVEHRKRLEEQRQRRAEQAKEKESEAPDGDGEGEEKQQGKKESKDGAVSKAKKREEKRRMKFKAEGQSGERPKKKLKAFKPSGSGANALPLG